MKKWLLVFIFVLLAHSLLINKTLYKQSHRNTESQNTDSEIISISTALAKEFQAEEITLQHKPALEQGNVNNLPVNTSSILEPGSPTEFSIASSKTTYAQPILQTPPNYPAKAREKKQQGAVTIAFMVNKSGLVSEAQITHSSGFEELDTSAKNSLFTWQFTPTLVGSEKVNYWYQKTFNFHIEQEYKYIPYGFNKKAAKP